jgi:hypothetical protein
MGLFWDTCIYFTQMKITHHNLAMTENTPEWNIVNDTPMTFKSAPDCELIVFN